MSKSPLKIDLIASAQKLASSGQDALSLFQQGDINVMLFVPSDQDNQSAHKRDELYFIQAGHGIFKRGDQTVRFSAGDMLFVPATQLHRFASFSADFKAWVIFFGPQGGGARE